MIDLRADLQCALALEIHQFVTGGHSEIVEQAVALMTGPEVDHARLLHRAEEEALAEALVELERIVQRVRRGEQIPSYELQEISRRLQRER